MTAKRQLKKRASIKWRIFCYMLGFCVLLLIILWLFQTVFLDAFYKQIKLNEVTRAAQQLAGYQNQNDGESFLAAIRGRGDLHVEIWSANGGSQVYGSMTDGGPPEMQSMQEPSHYGEKEKAGLLAEASAAGGTVVKQNGLQKDPFSPKGKESMLCAVALDAQTVMIVSAYITPVNATVQTLRVQLIYISALMLLASAALALILSRHVSRPIVRLNESANELAQGNYDAAFEGGGYREITELAGTLSHAAAELGKTEQLRRELIANVSHDLRTPLTLITGYGEMIRDLPDENTPENMQVIIDESKRLTSLVANLLDLSRLQSGAYELRMERYDLTDQIRGIIGRFSRFCQQEGYEIYLDAQESVQVTADPDRLAQVVYNFILNAINHTEDDRRIQVSQTVCAGRVRIAVADNGEGIAKEDLPMIWDRYYKVDKLHKRDKAGTGLGLSIVKSILTQHPGVEYGVESEPGKGSTFWFSLPLLS